MAKFSYKYENIKRIKKIFEKEIQRQISELNIKIQRLNEYKEELIREKENEKRKILEKSFVENKELHFYSKFEKYINEKLEYVEEKIKTLENEKKEKIEELVQKSKETKIFEKLEEHHKNEFETEQNRLEQIRMDEIALKKQGKAR